MTTTGELARTDRWRLRPWTAGVDDLARLADLYVRPEVTRWLGGPPRVSTAELVGRWQALGALDQRYGSWAIETLRPVRAVGTVLLRPLPDGVGEVEVAWHLHPDAWGQGYATEAARAVIARAFAEAIPEVYAVVRPGNDASTAVCRRLGMTHVGRLRRWYGVELETYRLIAPLVVD